MRGSLLVNFNEFLDGRGGENFSISVNNDPRDLHFTDIDNYYSTFIFTGDTVTFVLDTTSARIKNVTVIRKDFTNDDENGDRGIKETNVSYDILNNAPAQLAIRFTGSTIPAAYNFHYVINAETLPTPTPTPTSTPTPTPTPTPGCIYPVGTNYFEYYYNWNVNPSAEQPDFYVQEFGVYYELISGGCFTYNTVQSFGDNQIKRQYTTYSGTTNWNTSFTSQGPAGTRNIYVGALFAYNTGTTTNMYRLDSSYGEIYINNVLQGTRTWVDWDGTPPDILPDAFYPYVVPQPDAFYKRRYLQFGNLTFNPSDTIKIIMYDNLEPKYNDFYMEYNWQNSSETGSFNITGDTLYTGGYTVYPQFTTGLTGSSGSYLTPRNRVKQSGGNMLTRLYRCNSTIADRLNFRTGKIFIDNVEVTGVTQTVTGGTSNFYEVCPNINLVNKSQNYGSSYQPFNNFSQVKFQISDNFATPTPTPTQTPTATPTPTPTPTPAPVLPITWNLTYKMTSGGAPTGTKEVNNMYFTFNGITYTRPNFTWVSSANTNYGFPQDNNSAFEQIFVGRELCRRSGASSLTLDRYQLRIIVNSVVVYNVTTNISNRSIPTCPTFDDVYVGTTSLTINGGDVVTVEYTDIFV